MESGRVSVKRAALKTAMYAALTAQGDPRMAGHGDIFDRYPYSNPASARFYERYMRGEKLTPNWVKPTDFEKAPLD